MKTLKRFFLISWVLVLSLASISYGENGSVVIGDWEMSMDNWTEEFSSGDHSFSFSRTCCATLNSYGLRVVEDEGEGGMLDLPLKDPEVNLCQWFLDNCCYDKFEMDVTLLASDWIPDGSPDPYVYLIVGTDAEGWCIAGSLPLGWDPSQGDRTFHCVWDLSECKEIIISWSDDCDEYAYVDITIFLCHSGYSFPVAYCIDNARLTCYCDERATEPIPPDDVGCVDHNCVDTNVVLSWSPGDYAASHDVYFGTDEASVTDANRTNPLGVLVRQDLPTTRPRTTYDIAADANVGILELCTTYYWRIDDVNDPNICLGDVWSFTTCCCVPPPANMVAWWPLDETVGDTSEELVNNNNGTWIDSPTPVTGMVDGALSFSVGSDYVDVPNSPELNFGTGDLTVDMWVNLEPNTVNTGIRTIVDKRTIGASTQGYTVFILDGVLFFQLADGEGSSYCSPTGSCMNYYSGVTIADNEWHFIAVTVDRSETDGGIWYVDGIEVGNRFNPTYISEFLTNSAPLWIGRHANWGTSYISGILDEIELFNRVLDANEIREIYEAGSAGKCKCKPGLTYKDDIKWSQPPAIDYMGCIDGWDEISEYNRPPIPIVADDWVCLDDRPIKDIHWWGSFKGWTEPNQVPPDEMPSAFHIGIWTDVPDPDPNDPNTFSHPNELVWENICDSYVWSYAGCDIDPRKIAAVDACFKFDQLLSQDKWFSQESNEPNGTVYWLSIVAIYDGNTPEHPWGWKTRPHFCKDDAVRITDVNDGLWPPVIGSFWENGEPIEYPEGTSWDMAFVLTTNRKYTPRKWHWPNEEISSLDLYPDGIINFKDFAIMAEHWLNEAELYPCDGDC